MISNETSLNFNSLLSIINYLNKRRFFIVDLKRELGIETSNNGYGTSFINPSNKIFSRIEVHVDKDEIESVTMYGKFEFSFTDLIQYWGPYRKVFVPYDNLNHYFFNENKEKGNYVLETYTDDEDANVGNWSIPNIQIRWDRDALGKVLH